MRRLVVLAAVLWAATAEAHKPSDSYLTLVREGEGFTAQWDLALRDLEDVLGLDADGDGAITWGELRARHAEIAAYALSHLHLERGGAECTGRPTEQLVDHHTDGAYTVLRFAVACPQAGDELDVRYSLLFDVDPQHRGIVRVSSGGEHTLLLTSERPEQRVDLAESARWRTVVDFWRDGVWHIWSGFDHILFLLTLLMPAVLRRESGRWRGVDDFGDALVGTLKVVTAFTLAHSITLSLAALDVIHLPSRLVESGIAASVIVAALHNTRPALGDERWLLGFVFGLLHGFGFASVLADPGLPSASIVLALFGFNAGVETGQLVIVAAFLPLAYLARRSWFYQRFTLVVGSSVIAAIALVWFLERAFDLRFAVS